MKSLESSSVNYIQEQRSIASSFSTQIHNNRRQFLQQAIAAVTATALPSVALAQEQEVEQSTQDSESQAQHEGYEAPQIEYFYNQEALAKHEPAKFVRWDNVQKTNSVKVELFNGVVNVYSLQYLEKKGWIKQNYQNRTQKGPQQFTVHTKKNPDVINGIGSGSIIELHVGGQTELILLSNDHVIRGAHKSIDSHAVSDVHCDINFLAMKNTNMQSGDLPKTTVSNSTTNPSILHHEVRVHNIGQDLFEITGKPFPLTTKSTHNGVTKQTTMFAFTFSGENIHSLANFQGVSGSVVEDKEGLAVGVVHSVTHLTDSNGQKYPVLIFTGPEDLQALQQEYMRQQSALLAKQKPKNTTVADKDN